MAAIQQALKTNLGPEEGGPAIVNAFQNLVSEDKINRKLLIKLISIKIIVRFTQTIPFLDICLLFLFILRQNKGSYNNYS